MYKFIIILIVSVCYICPSFAIELIAFNAGQANFNAIKHQNKVVLFDVGSRYNQDKLSNLLKSGQDTSEQLSKDPFVGCRIEAVFISHPHLDHFSHYKHMNQYYNTDTMFILGGEATHWETKTAKGFLEGINKKQYLHSFKNYDSLQNSLNDIFGNNINFHIIPFIPTTLGDLNGNSLSQPIIVTCGKQNIWITGDANGHTIAALDVDPSKCDTIAKDISNEIQNQDLFTTDDSKDDSKPDIDISNFTSALYNKLEQLAIKYPPHTFFIPHHGSLSSGSNIWSEVLLKLSSLAIVCSNPNIQHKLPHPETLKSFYALVGQEAPKNSKRTEGQRLFITSNAAAGYYKFTLDSSHIKGGKQQQTKDIKKTQGKPEKQLLKAEKSLAKATNKQLKAKEAVAAAAEQKKQAKQDIATAKKEIKLANGQAKKKAPSASSTKK